MHLRRSIPPGPAKPLRIERVRTLDLDSSRQTAHIDGRSCAAKLGCWMFYVPGLEAKFFHARNGCIDCTHDARPPAEALRQPDRALGRYLASEWSRALSTSTTRRLAETWLTSARLWQAGLGPQPLGLCFAKSFKTDGEALGPTCGFLTENVFRLPRKLRCREEHIRRAGVRPDKIRSCVRQQVRGYVIDLCSVVGCIPDNADTEIAGLELLIRDYDTSERALRDALQSTLQ